jgi:hypothetical protein
VQRLGNLQEAGFKITGLPHANHPDAQQGNLDKQDFAGTFFSNAPFDFA